MSFKCQLCSRYFDVERAIATHVWTVHRRRYIFGKGIQPVNYVPVYRPGGKKKKKKATAKTQLPAVIEQKTVKLPERLVHYCFNCGASMDLVETAIQLLSGQS